MSGSRVNTNCRMSCLQCCAVRQRISLPWLPAACYTISKHMLTAMQTELPESDGARREHG
jgi:hypothetical protein